MATGNWWVIGFFAAEPESLTEDINGEPPTSTEYIQGTAAQAAKDASLAVNGKAFGPYSSKAAAQAAVKAGKVTGDQPTGGALISGAAIPGLTDIANFFDKLGEANTWVRVGEVVLGLVLIAAGIAKITHAVPVATEVAKAAGTAALL